MSPLWMVAMVGTVLLPAGTLALGLVSLRLLRAQRVITQYEDQLARLQEGTALLTETMELGFRQLAEEIERLGGRPPASSGTASATVSGPVAGLASGPAPGVAQSPASGPAAGPRPTLVPLRIPPKATQAANRAAQTRDTGARVTAALASGRGVADIAADEQISEGEVRLHLALLEAADRWTGRKETHATLRA